MNQADRIKYEREQMTLHPWQFAPSEVDDGANPYPSCAEGHRAWIQAQSWRAEIRERDPSYFNDALNQEKEKK